MSTEVQGNTAGTRRREQILDVAVGMFADRGFESTTMRAVAEEIGTTAPLVIYHFATKLELYRAVFARYQHLNEERRRQVLAVDPSASDAVERIVDAFLMPTLKAQETADGKLFARLVLREASDPSAHDRGILAEYFDPMARDFIAVMRKALPDKPQGFHEWAYMFGVGALTGTALPQRIASLSDVTNINDFRYDYLRTVLIAGWRGAGPK
ncbi:TetR/AcrR family transcriptional regulator [Paenarthrobacter nitroguajacolicus]|uniref:TetR/AcrR family transcriptional regulator n=1 Tax=Paenarthrobacter nitroguajacolicus TaxID=211146 RepID=UPI00248C7CA5|nr:TetR/AcrR family transcriptional regulator [Paenarthrobacter nitroguajacolicus]